MISLSELLGSERIYQLRTKAPGPAGKLPLDADMLLHHLQHLRDPSATDTSVRVKIEIGGTDADQASKPFFWRIFKLGHVSDAEGQVISLVGDDLSVLYQSELKLMSIEDSVIIRPEVKTRNAGV